MTNLKNALEELFNNWNMRLSTDKGNDPKDGAHCYEFRSHAPVISKTGSKPSTYNKILIRVERESLDDRTHENEDIIKQWCAEIEEAKDRIQQHFQTATPPHITITLKTLGTIDF